MTPVALASPARGRLRLRSNVLGVVDVRVWVEARTDGVAVSAAHAPDRVFGWDGLRAYATDNDSSSLTLYVGHYGETLVIDLPDDVGHTEWITAFRAHGLRAVQLSDGWE
jgi:hypothetical protein